MRAIVGLDLNGWRDMAARDWDPDEPNHRIAETAVIDGGTCGVAVQLSDGAWLGGPQAILAPHGRGPGWGTGIGAPERRRALLAAWAAFAAGEEAAGVALRATAEALSRGAQERVVAIPDLPDWDERLRSRLIGLLRWPRSTTRLLWRPVALFLDALETGAIPREAVDRECAVILHHADGLELQRLTLRQDDTHPGHLAPQRAGPGRLVLPRLGLARLIARMERAVHAANPSLDWERIDPPRLAARLLFDAGPPEPELLRHKNGTWVSAVPPEVATGWLIDAANPLPSEFRNLPALLATPLAPPFAKALQRALAPAVRDLRLVPWEGVARGALKAGRLIAAGLPHYYDRLEPIAMAILEGRDPVWRNLIEDDDKVPANREYVSPEIRGLGWGAGKTSLEVYLLKGGAEVRHWQAERAPGPPQTSPVTLQVRQTPGQSWARLTLSGEGWPALARNPLSLDWDGLSPVNRPPEDVLESLRHKPVIPDPLHDPAHIDMWRGGDWAGGGLLADLPRIEADPVGQASCLADRLQQRRIPAGYRGAGGRVYAIGTDGSFPPGLPDETAQRFDAVLDRIARHVLAASPRRPLRDNEALRALTWSFTRCPEAVQEALVDALEARLRGEAHPLVAPARAIRVATHGAGRAVCGQARLARLLAVLRQRDINTDTANALAMALSRRMEAPEALDAETVAELLDKLARSLIWQVQTGAFKDRFRNTLSALAGLFRWRVVEPFALLRDSDSRAATVHALLEQAEELIVAGIGQINQPEAKRSAIAGIRALLEGQGSADILRQLEEASGLDE